MSDWRDEPRGDGYYWVLPRGESEVELVRVVADQTWVCGSEEASPLFAYPEARWCWVPMPDPPD